MTLPLINDHLTENENSTVLDIIEKLHIKSFIPRRDPNGEIRIFDYDSWCWMPTKEALEKIYKKGEKLNFSEEELSTENKEIYRQLLKKYFVNLDDET